MSNAIQGNCLALARGLSKKSLSATWFAFVLFNHRFQISFGFLSMHIMLKGWNEALFLLIGCGVLLEAMLELRKI